LLLALLPTAGWLRLVVQAEPQKSVSFFVQKTDVSSLIPAESSLAYAAQENLNRSFKFT
jgi:hypothetical protein